jgi:hypothetical protein
VALGRKTGGKDWKPGQSGNPNGRIKISPEHRKLMELNKQIVAEIFSKYMGATKSQLEEARRHKDTPMFDQMVISTMLQAINKGDKGAFDFLLNRAVGKVKDEVHHTGSLHGSLVKELEENRKKSNG